nr:hypothetical protein [Candidatus Sigynarchaeota archaeon]
MSVKKLICPLCLAEEVERIKFTTPQGKDLVKSFVDKISNERERKKLLVLQKIQASDTIFIYHCLRCNNFEVWNTELKKSLVKLSLIDIVKPPEKKQGVKAKFKISNEHKEIIGGIAISTGIAIAACYALYYSLYFLSMEGFLDFPFETTLFEETVHSIVFISVAVYIVAVIFFSHGILTLIDKKMRLQEFTMKLHQFMYGQHLYYLEFNSKYEKKTFGASLKRATYGSTLILGIAILILEEFLVIPDLKPFFMTATYATIISLAASMPFIIILLDISPLLTKEVNLYYFDKKDRIVKNVGSWLEDALHFFAIVDIILTFIVLIDSQMTPSWFLFIAGFVMFIFVFFLIFTIMFNKKYHTRLKEKYIEYLKGTYNLPVRKASIFLQHYYCRNCGQEVDVVQQDRCQKCNMLVHKCMICGDVVDTRHIVGKTVVGIDVPDAFGKITDLIDKMESKMGAGPGKEFPSIQCPSCQKLAHLDEFIAWLKLRGTCPVCKAKLNFFDLF